jgi:hypothetical protein
MESSRCARSWWINPSRDWWLKHQHALGHLRRLRQEVQAYQRREPIMAIPEPGRQDNEIQFRLQLSEPVPATVGLVAGDVVHSLRSALDNMAFAMVESRHGRQLQEREAKQIQFPITRTPSEFGKFFDGNDVRRSLMADPIRAELQRVQPFYWLSEAKRMNVEKRLDANIRR